MNLRITLPRSGRLPGLFLTFAVFVTLTARTNAQSLGAADSFGVLGASTVTNTGASHINGNVGVSPGSAITGFPPGIIINGSLHAADGLATQAHADYATAYATYEGLASPPANNLSGADLGGMTLVPGVYRYNTSAASNGMLTFDAQSDPTARFVIQIGTTLITSSNSSVLLLNGADAKNIYFQVGTSVTLGSGSSFIGNLLAHTAITCVGGVIVTGRLMTLTGAVTLDTNQVVNPVFAPTPTPSPTATSSPAPSPTATPTPVGTPTPTGTPSQTGTPLPTGTPGPTGTASPTASPFQTPAQLLNISTRLKVQTGENVLIGGFIITGNAPKTVIVRGIGPSLLSAGVAGVLADPMLELHGGDGALIAANDNWKDTQQTEIQNSSVPPVNDFESAIVATLVPSNYTIVLRGRNETSGIGLVEMYDLDAGSDSNLANISTRGFVLTGSDVMIAGFILGNGTTSEKVAIRAIGPSLASSGIVNALADPMIELHDSNGALLMSDDNWRDDEVQAAEIIAAGLSPQNDLESALITKLPPGAYTAIVSGMENGTGVGVTEVYHLP